MRSRILLSVVLVGIATLWWSQRNAAQPPAENQDSAAASRAQRTAAQPAQPAAAPRRRQAAQRRTAAGRLIDEAAWPADGTVTVQLVFGLKDQQPASWDGKLTASGARVVRMRGWRFDEGMTVDTETGSFKCGSWLGPEPVSRLFDVHLPQQPRPFVRPGLLVDLDGGLEGGARLQVTTAQGDFTVDVARLAAGSQTALDGRVRVGLAVFGRPVATRAPSDVQGRRVWHDYPSIALAPAGDEVVVAYQTYDQDAGGDRIEIRRRAGGLWQASESLTPPAGDYYRTAAAFDGRGSLWVVYAAQVDGNWDLYGRRRDEQWAPAERLTEHPQPDMHHLLVRDADGALWLVWQGFRGGQSDVLARRWDGAAWGAELRVSDSAANDWEPAAAACPDGGIAVAWDTYDQGNYDLRARRVRARADGYQLEQVYRVTGGDTLEARPSIACDRQGRWWIAYDTGGPHWGKDTGFWLEMAAAPQGTRLYVDRGIGVAVIDPRQNAVLVPGSGKVEFASLDRTLHEHVEYPLLACDADGRMWLFCRRRAALQMGRRGIGRQFQWELCYSRFDPAAGGWTEPQLAADSAGRLDARSSVALAGEGAWLAWPCDHRLMEPNRPDLSSVMAGPLWAGETGEGDVSRLALRPAEPPAARTRDPVHADERRDVARLRGHAVAAGGQTYRIWRGDMHRHTETSSDGGSDGSMLEAYRYALDAAAMDFLLVTDHNDGSREYDWWLREKFNDLFHVGEAFVGLYGYERSVSYPNGHRNVFFTRRGTRPLAIDPRESGRDPTGSGELLYPYLRRHGGICFSHTSATGMGTDWRDNDPQLEPLVEIFQGDRTNYEQLGAPWSADPNDTGTQEGGFQPLGYVNLALAKGYKLGFQSSSDHLSTHLSYSCILAEKNTRQGLFEAMRKRHAYAATDNILLDVRSRGTEGPQIMGDVFTSPAAPRLDVQVVGTGRLQEVVVIKDGQVVYATQPEGREARFAFTDMQAAPGRESYYYVRVLQANRRLAWSSPMWITPAAGTK